MNQLPLAELANQIVVAGDWDLTATRERLTSELLARIPTRAHAHVARYLDRAVATRCRGGVANCEASFVLIAKALDWTTHMSLAARQRSRARLQAGGVAGPALHLLQGGAS